MARKAKGVGKATKRTPKKRNRTAVTRAVNWKPKFIARLRECGNVKLACDATNIDRATAYRHREDEEGFAKQWQVALEDASDVLEKEAWRRAVTGVKEPVFGKGEGVGAGTEIVGAIRKYSDVLLIFLLKGANPDKYKDRVKAEVSGEIHVEGFETIIRKVYGVQRRPGTG